MQKKSNKFSISKVLQYKWNKMDLFEQEPNSKRNIKWQDMDNAHLWRVKKIIMGISYRNLRG